MKQKDRGAASSPQGAAPAPLTLAEINARHRGAVRRYFVAHPVVMDVVVVLSYLLLSLATVISQIVQGNWAAPLLVVAIAAALFFRRRVPLVVFAVVMVLELLLALADLWASNLSAGLWFALYAVGTNYRRRVAVIALLVGPAPLIWRFVFGTTAAQYAQAFTNNQPEVSDVALRLSIVLTTYLSCIIAVGFGIAVRQRRRYEAAIAAWAEQSTQWGRSAERSRIAREMHDVVAHSLTVMVSLADGASTVLRKDPERAGQVLGELSRTGRAALADTRRVLGVLREDDAAPLAPLETEGDMERMVSGFRTAGLPLTFTYSGASLPADTTLRLSVYRIVQESLTNVLRYGRALSRVEVLVDHTPGLVAIRVMNDGVGAAPAPGTLGSGQGIPGMRARAAMYGGTVAAAPLTGGGWLVTAELHYTAEPRRAAEPRTADGRTTTNQPHHDDEMHHDESGGQRG
ncbi:sensor histidine kinase [Arthrobacter sp. NPDC090010]|uniref:sensor histidine kinase n=1 Tax=Arthrobacter sp. NPDC090010 TaxID=3363942 RepID=UPI00381CBDEB